MLNTVKVYRIVLLGAAAMIVLLVLLCILIAANGRKKAEELGEAEEPEESEGSRELLKETEEKATAPKQKAPEVTRVLPARKIRRQTENTEKAVPEQKTQESKEPPAADSQPKEPQQTQTPEEKTEKDGLLPDSMERKKGKKQKPSGNTEDLGLEFFDVDDL
jgi:Mg-chelatase subunit ChlI